MSRERENKEINAHLLTTPSKPCVARRRQLNDDSSFIADMRGSCKYRIFASGRPIWRRRNFCLVVSYLICNSVKKVMYGNLDNRLECKTSSSSY